MIEDAELLRRYAEDRSETAFAELVQRRLGLVYSVAYRQTRDAHRAQDVAQAVFAALAREAAALSRQPVLVGWLYRSARFTAIDILRAEQSRARREEEAHAMQEIQASENSDAEWAQVRPLLDEALGDLPERDRDAILLRYFDDRPFADIGARLRLTENAARMRVERALDRLHAALARRGLRSTAAALGVALANQAGYAVPAGLAATVTGAALAGVGAAGIAGGAATVGGGVGASFMALSKLQVGVAALVVTAGVGTALLYQLNPYDSPSAIVPVSPAVRAALREPASSAIAESSAAQAPAPTLASALTPVPLPPAAPAARPASAVPDAQLQQWLAAFNSPDALRAFAAEARGLTMNRYGDLLAQLNLGPERTEAFARLLDEARQAPMDLAVANLKNGIDPEKDMDAFEASIHAARAGIDREIQAFLGEADYGQYVAYNQDRAVRDTYIRLGRLLDNTPDALTPQQSLQLHAVLRTGDGKTLPPEKILLTHQFLSPPQVAALEKALAQQRGVLRGRLQESLLAPPREK